LITHHIFQIWPCWTTTCSLDWKTIESCQFSSDTRGHCCNGDLVGWITFWISFLTGLRKLEQRAKKCIELRWEYKSWVWSL
jgi:hypothetical protein